MKTLNVVDTMHPEQCQGWEKCYNNVINHCINKLLFLIIFYAVTIQLLGKLEGDASEVDNEKAYIESKSWYFEATILQHSSFLVLWSLVFSYNVSS